MRNTSKWPTAAQMASDGRAQARYAEFEHNQRAMPYTHVPMMTPAQRERYDNRRLSLIITKGLSGITKGARANKIAKSRAKINKQGGLVNTYNRKKTTVKTGYIGSGPKITWGGDVARKPSTFKKVKSMVKFKTKRYGLVKGIGKLGYQMGRKWGSAAQRAAIRKLAEFNRKRLNPIARYAGFK